MILYCPKCQKKIQDCECGTGCAYKGPTCHDEPALYALQVCPDCVELPMPKVDVVVLNVANKCVAAIEEKPHGSAIENLDCYLWLLVQAVREWRKAQ